MKRILVILSFALICAFSAEGQGLQSAGFSPESSLADRAVDNSNQVRLYPNPVVDYLTVQIENFDLQEATFELHSLIGNEVRINPQGMGDGHYQIYLKDFPKGYYFLVVKDKRGNFKKAYRFLKN